MHSRKCGQKVRGALCLLFVVLWHRLFVSVVTMAFFWVGKVESGASRTSGMEGELP